MSRTKLGVIGLIAALSAGLAYFGNPPSAEAQKEAGKTTPAKSTGTARKVSWKELDGALDEIKSPNRPVKEDWEKGDKHLTVKLTSLLEEMKGRQFAAVLRMASNLTRGGSSKMDDDLKFMFAASTVEAMFERLGTAPVASDRKVSWEKLQGMLTSVARSGVVKEDDWKKGDVQVLNKLEQHLKRLGEQSNAIMLNNAGRDASGGTADLKSLFAVTSQEVAVKAIMEEVRTGGKKK